MARRDLGEWVPRTTLGKLVLKGEVTTMSEALATGLRLREPEIVDILLPEMEDEVLDVNMVQRMTDSGRRVNFVITVVVGNGDGFVGLGRARGREVGPSIRKAIDDAKLNIVEVKRGCGSWECGCLRAHTLPIKVTGRSGSVRVTLKPAPQGVGLAVGDVAKAVLRLGGIRDAWAFTQGRTKTTVNYALATFDAVRRSTLVKVTSAQSQRLKIHAGAEEVFVRGTPGAEAPPEAEVPAEGDAPVVETTGEATEPKDAEEAPAEMPEAPKDKEPEGNEGAEPAADTESKEES